MSMDGGFQYEDHERKAAQRRVEERRRRILDPVRRPPSRRGKIDPHLASSPRDSSTPSSPIHSARRRKRANSFSTNMSKLSLLNTSPTFNYPQPTHPQSAKEQSLSQELALCDFRSYLLAMEAQNHERLRKARHSEWAALAQSPVEQEEGELLVRDRQMEVQAGELAKLRMELQEQLEGLTGREYPLPETYLREEEEFARRGELGSSPVRSSLTRWLTDGH